MNYKGVLLHMRKYKAYYRQNRVYLIRGFWANLGIFGAIVLMIISG